MSLADRRARASPPQSTPDGCLATVVFAGKLGHCLAGSITLSDPLALANVEHGPATEARSLGLGALDAILAALANELSLELVKPAHHREDQLAMRCRGVEPRIIEGTELGAGSLHVIEQPQQVADRTRQAVELDPSPAHRQG